MVRRFTLASALLVTGSVFASVAIPMTAMAGTASSNLNVSASVTANCTISTSALAFGAYDPVNAHASSALDGTGSVETTCTNGASASITLGQGSNADAGSTDAAPLRRLSDGGGNNLSYSLYQDSNRTTVWGNTAGTGVSSTGTGAALNTIIYGSIPAGQNASAGAYTDTVTATVTF
ncbi:spore coat protein U domain-containing protein [Tolypothrix sp. FACHB-123]|uniref:Csu type fimbrial protein n=1 Tax=Tolypothrix sp. FACHB-123 TaxID=2692868 RepID=UPI001688F4DA|nr:spore coat U domain-containing protein [Tolypothrix sp. FACHB-123]MBD2359306.1 spore coat protein U domain-containing protein [Tolypothrix sp. FACHB-123]